MIAKGGLCPDLVDTFFFQFLSFSALRILSGFSPTPSCLLPHPTFLFLP
jgi:hypothetical protein